MKNSISIIFSGVIFFANVSISFAGDHLCSEEYKADLPKWFSNWKDPNYGLEFPEKPNIDNKLPSLEDGKMKAYNANGPGIIIKMVEQHLKKIEDYLPQFRIRKADPIGYEDLNNRKMWLILKNIYLSNLDTYDPKSVEYQREGHIESQRYHLTNEMYEAARSGTYKMSGELFKKTDGNQDFERKDIVWKIKTGAKFLSTLPTQQSNSSENKSEQKTSASSQTNNQQKPIEIQAEFKIQPQNRDFDEDAKPPLRASGVVTLHVYDFNFNLTIVVRHIDKCLQEHLPKKKKCWNRVPDFDLKYGMKKFVIHDVKLTEYDGDDEWQNEPENDEEDVNDKEVKNNDKNNKTPTIDEMPIRTYKYVQGNTEIVKEHLEILRRQIIGENSEGMLRKRLCINLAYKMTWKIMQMESKKQFPALVHEIIQYNDNFNRKADIPPASSIGWTDAAKTVASIGSAMAKTSVLRLFNRS